MIKFILWYFIIGFVMLLIGATYMTFYADKKVTNNERDMIFTYSLDKVTRLDVLRSITNRSLRMVYAIIFIALTPIWAQMAIGTAIREIDRVYRDKKEKESV